MLYSIQYTVSKKENKGPYLFSLQFRSLTPGPEPRRKWGFTPLCGAGATFSGSSKGPSRSEERGTKGRGELVNIIYINIKKSPQNLGSLSSERAGGEADIMEPRGIRNNNPLNIRLSSDKWQGQRPPSPRRGVGGEAEFCQFETMAYGWRAAFVILCKTYYGKYKLKTIRALITRWAPPKENNTEAYIRRVTDRIGIGPDRELGSPQEHPAQWMMIAMAMAIVECGTAQLDYLSMLKGFALAIER